jgi:tRNA pseudouridine38-40 synthase
LLTTVRIALGIEYDGSHYSGWQAQTGRPTLQASLEKALSAVADHGVQLTCAGRTDAAVHATGQVAHFDTSAQRVEHNWVLGCNSNLAPDIRVLWAKYVDESFHARYSARARRYVYLIGSGTVRPALSRQRIAWCSSPLDVTAMAVAAGFLVGEHDFSSLRSSACQARSPIRRIDQLKVETHADLITLEVSANAFLHHMVRNIAGLLIAVGAGQHPPQWVGSVLAARDRRCSGVTAPAQGLYLVDVRYPEHFALPACRAPTFII